MWTRPAANTIAVVVELPTSVKLIARRRQADADQRCAWSAANRIVCRMYGIARCRPRCCRSRLLAMDGGNQVLRPCNSFERSVWLFDGDVIDLLNGITTMLMARSNLAETQPALASRADETGVDLVDTRTGKATRWKARPQRPGYVSDGLGNCD
jgi:hypothetical protein